MVVIMTAGVIIGVAALLGCVGRLAKKPVRKARATTATCWKPGPAAPVFWPCGASCWEVAFAFASLVTGVAFVFLPRCAG